MARKTRLNSTIADEIAKRVQVGSYPYVAAQSLGIAPSTFYAWMARGEQGRKPYQELWEKVSAAQATARFSAEARVYRDNPLAWLRLGPGRGDWTDDPKRLVVQGDPENPVQVEIDHQVEGLAEMLVLMEELGYIRPGDNPSLFLTQNGGSDDDDETETTIDITPVGVQGDPSPFRDSRGNEPGSPAERGSNGRLGTGRMTQEPAGNPYELVLRRKENEDGQSCSPVERA